MGKDSQFRTGHHTQSNATINVGKKDIRHTTTPKRKCQKESREKLHCVPPGRPKISGHTVQTASTSSDSDYHEVGVIDIEHEARNEAREPPTVRVFRYSRRTFPIPKKQERQ